MRVYKKIVFLIIMSLLVLNSIQFAVDDIQETAYGDTRIEYRTDWLKENSFSGSFSITQEEGYLVIKPTFSVVTSDTDTTDENSYSVQDLLEQGSLNTSDYWASYIQIGCNGKPLGYSADMIENGVIYLPLETAKSYIEAGESTLEVYYYHRVPHKGGMAVVVSQIVWGNTTYEIKETQEVESVKKEDTENTPKINESASNNDIFKIITNPNNPSFKNDFDDIFLRNYIINGTVYIQKYGTNKKIQITEENKGNIGIKPGDKVFTKDNGSITLYGKTGGIYSQGNNTVMNFTASSYLSEDEEKTYLGMLENGKMSYLTNDSLSDEIVDNLMGKNNTYKRVIYSVASFFKKENNDSYNVVAGARSAYTMEVTENGIAVELIDGQVDLEILETGEKVSLESGEKVVMSESGEFRSIETFDTVEVLNEISNDVGFEIELKERSSGSLLIIIGVLIFAIIILIVKKIKKRKRVKKEYNQDIQRASHVPKPQTTKKPLLTQECLNCGALITEDMKFCGSCGTKIERKKQIQKRFCPSCGNPINPEDRFCGSCGEAIK
ncbi:MAG: zinc ribbon domain-containing protein [Bacillota bacterium]|nr:zinc ribbon domain-containing protein [Bacillota bacterium]